MHVLPRTSSPVLLRIHQATSPLSRRPADAWDHEKRCSVGKDRDWVGDTWIESENGSPLFDILRGWTGYAFDESDRLAVTEGIYRTDGEANRCYEYELVGDPRLLLSLARTPGDDPVALRLRILDDHDAAMCERIRTTLELLHRYRFSR